ncbi:MAG TPA: hypothetical protein VEC16_04395 [Alphaproteobacteria bacterium]|nr:hypothetical protein [Alphaproteobacteria bacterium]
MNKLLCAGIISLAAIVECAAQNNKKIRTEEIISDPITTVGYISNKQPIDEEFDRFGKNLEIQIFDTNDTKHTLLEDNEVIFDRVKKGDLILTDYMEKSLVTYNRKKILSKKIKNIIIINSYTRPPQPGDSLLIHKFMYKLF